MNNTRRAAMQSLAQGASPLNPAMTVDFKDFVGKFSQAFDPGFCQHAINYFDRMQDLGFGRSRQVIEGVPAHLKDTIAFNTTRAVSAGATQRGAAAPGQDNIGIVGVPGIQDYFLAVVWACYQIYTSKYSALATEEAEQGIYEIKIQKTLIGGGFHVWHWEQVGRSNTSRIMNVQLFLNDVTEGGETEFLYYPRREPARANTLLIYPGNYTHTHRGNPPISNDKYLINAWIEF